MSTDPTYQAANTVAPIVEEHFAQPVLLRHRPLIIGRAGRDHHHCHLLSQRWLPEGDRRQEAFARTAPGVDELEHYGTVTAPETFQRLRAASQVGKGEVGRDREPSGGESYRRDEDRGEVLDVLRRAEHPCRDVGESDRLVSRANSAITAEGILLFLARRGGTAGVDQ